MERISSILIPLVFLFVVVTIIIIIILSIERKSGATSSGVPQPAAPGLSGARSLAVSSNRSETLKNYRRNLGPLVLNNALPSPSGGPIKEKNIIETKKEDQVKNIEFANFTDENTESVVERIYNGRLDNTSDLQDQKKSEREIEPQEPSSLSAIQNDWSESKTQRLVICSESSSSATGCIRLLC